MPFEIGPDIETLRADALVLIDNTAGDVRSAFITIVPGQAETYRDKLDDCRAYLATTDPILADYPWVAAEATAQDLEPQVAAQTVVATYSAWRALGSAVEQARLSAKRQIGRASTAAAIATQRSQGVAALRAFLEQSP